MSLALLFSTSVAFSTKASTEPSGLRRRTMTCFWFALVRKPPDARDRLQKPFAAPISIASPGVFDLAADIDGRVGDLAHRHGDVGMVQARGIGAGQLGRQRACGFADNVHRSQQDEGNPPVRPDRHGLFQMGS